MIVLVNRRATGNNRGECRQARGWLIAEDSSRLSGKAMGTDNILMRHGLGQREDVARNKLGSLRAEDSAPQPLPLMSYIGSTVRPLNSIATAITTAQDRHGCRVSYTPSLVLLPRAGLLLLAASTSELRWPKQGPLPGPFLRLQRQ